MQLKIGITGGIGSGKTTVCKVFELLGVPVFYADAAAKEVMHTDEELMRGIIGAFGALSFSNDGILNRKYLADIVFSDDKALEMLNALVHPAVFRSFDKWLLKHKQYPYVLKEAALLFESGSYKMCTHSILVKAPERLKIGRVMERDNITEAEVRARMVRQYSDEEKEALADYSILNDERLLLIPQVLKLHELFISMNPILA
ncbi:dephospho-CoA kinase [Flavihumibacter sp. R14]|nr:dephospho-CoA kinase [Flavihumibacter soli]